MERHYHSSNLGHGAKCRVKSKRSKHGHGKAALRMDPVLNCSTNYSNMSAQLPTPLSGTFPLFPTSTIGYPRLPTTHDLLSNSRQPQIDAYPAHYLGGFTHPQQFSLEHANMQLQTKYHQNRSKTNESEVKSNTGSGVLRHVTPSSKRRRHDSKSNSRNERDARMNPHEYSSKKRRIRSNDKEAEVQNSGYGYQRQHKWRYQTALTQLPNAPTPFSSDAGMYLPFADQRQPLINQYSFGVGMPVNQMIQQTVSQSYNNMPTASSHGTASGQAAQVQTLDVLNKIALRIQSGLPSSAISNSSSAAERSIPTSNSATTSGREHLDGKASKTQFVPFPAKTQLPISNPLQLKPVKLPDLDCSRSLLQSDGSTNDDSGGSDNIEDEEKRNKFMKRVKQAQKLKSKAKKPWYTVQNTSRYRGVSWHKRDKRYVARYSKDGRSKHVGNYKSEVCAAVAVDGAVLGENEKERGKINFGTAIERDFAELVIKHFCDFDRCEERQLWYEQDAAALSRRPAAAAQHVGHDEALNELFHNKISLDCNGYPNDMDQIFRRILRANRNLKHRPIVVKTLK